MAWYRMYFVDRLHRTRVPHDLQAQDDKEALGLAFALQYACFDDQVSIELWQGARRVLGTARRTPAELRSYWEEACAKSQQALLQTEEALRSRRIIPDRGKSLLQRATMAHATLTRDQVSAGQLPN